MADIPAQNPEEVLFCPACGHENIPGADSCVECSQILVQENDAAEEDPFTILDRPVRALNPRSPVCVERSTSLAEVITLLKGKNVGCVLVVDETGSVVGIFTERDVLYRVAGLVRDLEAIPVESLMTPRPTTLKKTAPMSYALHLMGLHGFRHIPLVDDADKPIGFIAFRDIVRFIEECYTDKPTG